MSDDNGNHTNTAEINSFVSTNSRGGLWLPVVLGAFGVGVVLSGIFTGSVGLYGDINDVTMSDGFKLATRELFRIVVFSLLLLGALHINSWRMRRQMGNLLMNTIRCLAIVSLLEAIRVAQIDQGVLRTVFISASQYVVCVILVLSLFKLTIREAFLFVTGCAAGVMVLWLGAHLGIWIA